MDIEKAFGKRVEEEPGLEREFERLRVEQERHNLFIRRVVTWVIAIVATWFLVGLVLALAVA